MTRTASESQISAADTADDVTRVAVSTVIFSLRRDSHGLPAPGAAAGATHTGPARGPLGTPGRLAGHRREPGCRGIPHTRRDDRTRAELSRAALRIRRRRPIDDAGRLDRVLGAASPGRRVDRADRPRLEAPENVAWFDAASLPAPRVRPQRHRGLRAVAAAQQGRLQPHRARPAGGRVHPRRAARGVRVDPRPPPRPRQLPPPGRELRNPHPDRSLPHGKPPAGTPLPLQPGRGARRSRPALRPVTEGARSCPP